MRPRSTALPYETYVPNPRQAFFHPVPAVGPSLVKGGIGGYRAGKSTACIQEVIELCLTFPYGISISTRKSVEGRAELSVIADLKKFLGPSGVSEWRPSERCFAFRNGHQHFCLPADDHERFGSMDLTHYFIQEAQEVDGRIFAMLNSRLSNPAGYKDGRPYYRGLIDARGVNRGHWVYDDFIARAWDVDDSPALREHVANPSFVYVKFRTRDNQHLRPGYYEDLAREHSGDKAWIDVYLEGEIGIEVEGRPVFGDSFDVERHVAEISEDPSLPILRGWDFGYRAPAVAWLQYDRYGRLLLLHELCPKNLSTDSLIDLVLAEQANKFRNRSAQSFRDYVDAAGDQINSSEARDVEILEDRLGTTCEWRKARIESGLNVMRGLMLKTVKVKGEITPRFLVDASCETFISAARGSYHYPEDNPKAPPIKGGSYVAVSDCVRYVSQLVVDDSTIAMPIAQFPRPASIGRW